MNTNKIVVISRGGNLQSLSGVQWNIQDPTIGGGQQQQVEEISSGGGGSATSVGNRNVSTNQQQPVAVCFQSSGHLLNSVVITSSANSGGVGNEILTSQSHHQQRQGQGDDVETEETSGNLSGDEYSYQENEEELFSSPNGGRRRSDQRSPRAPSMNLRYTGTRIPGRGFDGNIGKCILYRDALQEELTLAEVIDILANPDHTKLSTMPPLRPKGGAVYLYRCPDFETRHDLRSDGYLWVQQGTKKIPKEDPTVKRFYMYIRTEEPIKNVSKRPKKTFTKYDVRFKKCEYELINAEDPLVLVHYTGDENVWKPFRQNPTPKSDDHRRYMQLQGRGTPPGASRASNYPAVITQPVAPDGFDSPGTPQNREQIRSYMKFHDRSRNSRGGSMTGSPAKRLRSSDVTDFNETAMAAEAIASMDQYESPMDDGLMNEPVIVDRRSGATGETYQQTPPPHHVEVDNPAPTVIANSNVTNAVNSGNTEARSKFESVWPAFEMCKQVRMQGFVHALSVIPQAVITAGNRMLLNVANDLAQLQAAKKTSRFEMYYVSAGPVASGFFLSTLLFRHCLFDMEPIVPVAFLIHERRNPSDHRRLFEMITEKCPDISASDCVFITDREFGNIPSVLPKATHLFSWHYIEDEVVAWVESNGGSNEETNSYLNDVRSLMKSKDVERFNKDLALKRRQWPAAFASFFDTCLKSEIITKGGRWLADSLDGGVYDPFCGVVIPTCNDLNDLVGDLVAWQGASLEQLLQCIYLFSEYYVREIERSMHQVGSFKLAPQYAHYARPPRRLRNFPELEVADPRQIVHYVRMNA